MISGNPSISELKIFGKVTAINEINVNRLASEHPLIEELTFSNCHFNVDGAMMFVRQLNSLQRFEFRVMNQSDCDRLLSQLDEKWQHQAATEDNNSIRVILNC